MSNMQQVAIIREETALGIVYLLDNPSAVQKSGVFDQIEYDQWGNIKLNKYQRESGEFAYCQHFLVYSEAHRTQRDLALAVQREIDRMRLDARQSGLDGIRAHLSNAGYNVSKVVSPKETESKGKKDAGSEYEKPECDGCPSYSKCYGTAQGRTSKGTFHISYGTPQDETSARGYQGSGVNFDSDDETRVRFDPAYINKMARTLEDLLLQRRKKR